MHCHYENQRIGCLLLLLPKKKITKNVFISGLTGFPSSVCLLHFLFLSVQPRNWNNKNSKGERSMDNRDRSMYRRKETKFFLLLQDILHKIWHTRNKTFYSALFDFYIGKSVLT